jgi:hypothetical protein
MTATHCISVPAAGSSKTKGTNVAKDPSLQAHEQGFAVDASSS